VPKPPDKKTEAVKAISRHRDIVFTAFSLA